MCRKGLLALLLASASLPSVTAQACDLHLYLNPEKLGFFGGAVARMAGLTPPEPVFELEHPAMVKSVIGEDSEILVSYSRPFFSKDVRMELSGSQNVQLGQQVVMLDSREGTISIPYQLTGSGFDTITLTVIGQNDGEEVRQVGRVFVSPRRDASAREMSVSTR